MTQNTICCKKSIFLLIGAALLFTGCQSAYYQAMEKVGVHKRDLLVGRVEKARDAQAIASLKSELVSVESNVTSLIKEMEASIKEADKFIQSMGK